MYGTSITGLVSNYKLHLQLRRITTCNSRLRPRSCGICILGRNIITRGLIYIQIVSIKKKNYYNACKNSWKSPKLITVDLSFLLPNISSHKDGIVCTHCISRLKFYCCVDGCKTKTILSCIISFFSLYNFS